MASYRILGSIAGHHRKRLGARQVVACQGLIGISNQPGATAHYVNGDSFRYIPRRSYGHENSSTKNTFRLAELLPGAPSDLIHCQIREMNVDNHNSYEAVSYCWGNPDDLLEIDCNGKRLKIPSNLGAALRVLRLEDRSRYLWADAICINQSDPLDKAKQVPLMRSIYSRSQRTLIWLGTISDTTVPQISLLSKICIRFVVPILGLAGRQRSPKIQTRDVKTGRMRTLSALSGTFYLTMVYILRHPWFRRAWVVQEAAVSREVSFIFDHCEYHWDEIVVALKFLSGVKFPLAFISSPQHMAAIDHERKLYTNGGSSLPGVLVRHQRCLATDQRDKIFAFAGLINSESAERDVRVSYTDLPAVVYRELATRIIVRDKNLDIFSRLPTKEQSRLKTSLPSWVPDWSVTPKLNMSYTWGFGLLSLAASEARDGLGQRCCFAASRGSRYKLDISGAALVVPGYPLGVITNAGPVFEGIVLPDRVDRFRDIGRGWMQALRSLLHARSVVDQWQTTRNSRGDKRYPPTGEDMSDAFWETVCAGQYRNSPSIHRAAKVWERLTRPTTFRLTKIPHFFNILGDFYSVFVFVASLVKIDPLFEYRLQGQFAMNRRMVDLDSGFIGLANCGAEDGDYIFLLQGSKLPLILRRNKDSGTWRFVGDAYVHGAMNGEMWDEEMCNPVAIA